MTQTNKHYRMQTEQERIFEVEMMPHVDALYMYAYNQFVKNANDADDLVQETMLKAFKAIKSYEIGTNAKAWLFKILYNTYINLYRKKNKRPNQVDFEKIENLNNDESTEFTNVVTIEAEVFGMMLGDEVATAMEQLSDEARTVILLSDVGGFKYEEIAALLDIPIGTVRSRLFRARNTLKEILRDYAKTSFGMTDKRK